MGVSILVRLRRTAHHLVVNAVRIYYNKVWGMHIGEGTRVSLSAKLDQANPGGIHIGRHTALTFGSAMLSHDFPNRQHLDTRIGSYCFIGCGAIIMPGVTIGDHCIVGAGSIVMRDVPSNSVVMGNPARVIERDIMTAEFGVRVRPELPADTPQPALEAQA